MSFRKTAGQRHHSLDVFLVEVRMDKVKHNLLQIQEKIAPYKPNIIAVTKYFPESAIIEAYDAGLRDFGESRIIEASEKINNLPDEIKKNSKFHFIGHLQTNKVKRAVEVFDFIHSVDSVKLAEKISQEAGKIGKTQKVFVQINNANEEQKFGFSKEEIFEEFGKIISFNHLKVIGLMNMAPLGADDKELKRLFSEVREIKENIESKFDYELKELSMGMSQDYAIAAQEGATMLRIGRKLFE